jgi:hypothetical protein
MEFNGVTFTHKMANAVQVYLDVCRADEDNGLQFGVEERVSFPEHEKGFGTVDHWVCKSDMDNPGARMLSVNDYKNGMLLVEADSVQFKYYAFCLLHHPDLKHVVRVRLRVIQPNGFHSDGPVREHWTTREEIMDWGRTVLVPAMERTALDNALDAGSWCRFCPAKLVCPMLTGLFGAAAKCNPQDVVNLSEESLAREYEQLQAVGFYTKALKDEALRRMMRGDILPGIKLVPQKANRVWKEGAEEVMLARFGSGVWKDPEFKSPPQIEALGPEAVPLVREWAFTPQTGLTIVPESDPKPGVKIEKASSVFLTHGPEPATDGIASERVA